MLQIDLGSIWHKKKGGIKMSKKKTFLALFLCFLMLATCLSGCSKSTPAAGQGASGAAEAPKQIIRMPMSDFESMDPQMGTSSEVCRTSMHIFSRLFKFDDSGELVPDVLVDMPKVSSDGLVYSFELKPNVKFSNGDVMKSSDVKFTFERMFWPETKAINGWVIDMIKGAEDVADGKTKELAGFKIIDDTKFEITLEKPYAPFLQCLATPYMSIFPEKACREAGDNWGKQPIGSGPFKLVSWVKGEEVFLERNDDYFGEPTKIDEIHYVVMEDTTTQELEFKNGNIDVMYITNDKLAQYKDDPNAVLYPVELLHTSFLMFNVNNEYLKDARVRQAISIAIDREKLCETVLAGGAKPAYTFLSNGVIGYDENAKIEYNPEKAKELLKEAGYPNGFSIDIYQIQDSQSSLSLNTALQGALAEIGVKLNIIQIDNASWIDMRNQGKLTMYTGNWWGDYADPDNFLYTFFYSENAKTRSNNYNNPDFDNGLIEARGMTDEAKRAELYKALDHKVCAEDYVVAPLSHSLDPFVAQPNLKGFQVPITGTINFYKAYKE